MAYRSSCNCIKYRLNGKDKEACLCVSFMFNDLQIDDLNYYKKLFELEAHNNK